MRYLQTVEWRREAPERCWNTLLSFAFSYYDLKLALQAHSHKLLLVIASVAILFKKEVQDEVLN